MSCPIKNPNKYMDSDPYEGEWPEENAQPECFEHRDSLLAAWSKLIIPAILAWVVFFMLFWVMRQGWRAING